MVLVLTSGVKSRFFQHPDIRRCNPDKIQNPVSIVPSHVMAACTVTMYVWSVNQQCHAMLQAPLLLPPSGQVKFQQMQMVVSYYSCTGCLPPGHLTDRSMDSLCTSY